MSDRETRIKNFQDNAFGMFIHFGLYSLLAKGEWASKWGKINKEKYENLINSFGKDGFNIKETLSAIKEAGARYITITTRHHDGFSLYDTKGLSNFDVMHSAYQKDFLKEVVIEARKIGLIPFFYHTLIDWHVPMELNGDYSSYFAYLEKSIEILCTNYGPIGGFWFDGSWDFKEGVFNPERIYKIIRQYQKDALIINNTGLEALGDKGKDDVDVVTFERGKSFLLDNKDKLYGSEKCQILASHWGYCEQDINFKSVATTLKDILETRANNANYLLNVGPKGDFSLREEDLAFLKALTTWNEYNPNIIYASFKNDAPQLSSNKAYFLSIEGRDYLVIENVPMEGDPHVVRNEITSKIRVSNLKRMPKQLSILDNSVNISFSKINDKEIEFSIPPFPYGTDLICRVIEFIY